MASRRVISNTWLFSAAGLGIAFYGYKSSRTVSCQSSSSGSAELPKSDCLIYGVDTESSKWMVQYDYKTRNPRWAFEFMTRDGHTGKDSNRKNSKFFTDNAIESDGFKVSNNMYLAWRTQCLMHIM
jgi:hypothetical protein